MTTNTVALWFFPTRHHSNYDIVAGRSIDTSCPLCRGRIKASNDPQMLDVRCVDHECFVYNYHKDKQGRLLHGHFRTKHPAGRARA